MSTVENASNADLAEHSRAIIRILQTPEGAYPASPEFSAYRGYCWFRDGAFIADAMSACGDIDSAEAFFGWCASTTMLHGDKIREAVAAARSDAPLSDSDMLPARFHFDGSRGESDWTDFQLDGYGTWLWALGEHVARHATDSQPYREAIELTVAYLASSWERPCYDWWEESLDELHISTLGCIGAGLDAASRMGVLDLAHAELAASTAAAIRDFVLTEGVIDGHLVKWVGSAAVDGSLTSLIAPLGFIAADHPVARATVDAVEADLAVAYGVHRFVVDTFYGGGQWPLLSCFAGLARAALGEPERAADYLAWAMSTATETLDLPEQVDHHLLAPDRKQEWVDRWGEVATPLLWSHAMVLRLAKELER
ncbi:glycoside hydrolase family 15 protein [Demequina lutea]|uniref:GH15 family glucan-1,4-alpha-glucosidase n=1 Tax=Demequina lutea TaxID=431489 RepID=A0A7Y9ZDB3_9MICO|nr:glycoside hydrolase family 15 protein [Demequina lutea]NYI41860.1 GH15 family glucan-1,4-alpha-glucosidase [Demequina lutea]